MSKYGTYRSKGPSVIERYPELAQELAQLGEDQDRHFELATALCAPNGPGVTTPLFQVDILLLSVINRSLDLIEGFVHAYNGWNLSTAAPVVRMQVDNVLRLSLLAKAPVGSVTDILFAGIPLNKESDPLNNPGEKHKLTDQRLRKHARVSFPWLDLVYEQSSGWVHFSSVHIGVTMRLDKNGAIFGRFPSDIGQYPPDFLAQVLWAMRKATAGVLEILTWFASGKAEAASGLGRHDFDYLISRDGPKH